MKRKRYYLGHNGIDGAYVAFRSSLNPPLQTDYPNYTHVIGPFRTRRGALFMLQYGRNNPHCWNVGQAERLGKKYE